MAVSPQIASIIAGAYDKMAEMSLSIIHNYDDGYGLSQKQQELWARLIKTTKLVRVLSKFVEFDSNGDYVTVHRLSDTVVNDLLKYLIKVADLDNLPAAPKIFYQGPPAIRTAGGPGPEGPQGDVGPTGGGSDFQQLNFSADTVVSRFALSEARAAKWDYFVYGAGGRRSGTVRCHWSDDGLTIALPSDISPDDIGTTKALIEFVVELDGTDIVLKADVSSGTWSVEGTRYWIPGNGTYVPPVSGLLPNGQIYVGDTNNNAVGRTPGGVVSMSDTGVYSYVAGSITNAAVSASAAIAYSKLNLTGGIVNADINASAGIVYSKLNLTGGIVNADINASAGIARTKIASGSTNRLVINDGSGVMTDHTAITANRALVSNGSGLPIASNTTDTQIGYVGDVTSPIQAQIDALSASVAAVAGFTTTLINVGSWDMDTIPSVVIAHGIASGSTKIKSVSVKIYTDAGSPSDFLGGPSGTFNPFSSIGWGDTHIVLSINLLTSGYAGTDYNNPAINRGEILITYAP